MPALQTLEIQMEPEAKDALAWLTRYAGSRFLGLEVGPEVGDGRRYAAGVTFPALGILPDGSAGTVQKPSWFIGATPTEALLAAKAETRAQLTRDGTRSAR